MGGIHYSAIPMVTTAIPIKRGLKVHACVLRHRCTDRVTTAIPIKRGLKDVRPEEVVSIEELKVTTAIPIKRGLKEQKVGKTERYSEYVTTAIPIKRGLKAHTW